MNKSSVLERIRASKIIALIRADSPSRVPECAQALAEGGLDCLELTMTIPGAIQLCSRIVSESPETLVGLGTVLDVETALKAIDAGARFIVTPVVLPEVIDVCRELGVAILCGALTPTEVHAAWLRGADVIKIFPAEYFGPAYVKSLKAPFPQIKFMPTGGVTPDTLGEFLKAGAFAAAAGGALVSEASLREANWAAITARARAFATAAAIA